MKPPTSAQSAERRSRTCRRRPTRNRRNHPMKNQMKNQMKNEMKNHPVVVGLKDLLVGPKVLLAGQADRLGILVDLPADQAGHLEGAEEDGTRKA
jgi:hypothetical protein